MSSPLWALIVGILVFTIGRIIEKLYIERVAEFNKIRGEISKVSLYLVADNSIGNIPDEGRKIYADKLYSLASELAAFGLNGTINWFLNWFTFNARKTDILGAYKGLVDLSVIVRFDEVINHEDITKNFDIISEKLKLVKRSESGGAEHKLAIQLKGKHQKGIAGDR